MKGLTKDQIDMITAAVIQQWEERRKQEEEKKRDRRIHNTRLLLRNYRSFKHHAKDIEYELNHETYLDIMEELEQDEFAVEAIKRSKRRTIAMVRFIEGMLHVYGMNCRESGSVNELNKYETILHLYVNEPKMTVKEVAECQGVEERTVYRNIKNAVETLSVLIFGVDGIRLER